MSHEAPAEALLSVRIRHKGHGSRTLLRDFGLQLQAGEVLSLIGPSGCGKSSLLRILAGLDADFDGQVQIDGQPADPDRRDIGFVFQEPRLFPWLSVADNIAFDPRRPPDSVHRVEALLDEVGLGGLGRRLPKQLSGGQAQRVAIARSLFGQPRVLLLDEPFSAVDALTRLKLQELLGAVVREHRVAVLLVTHDVEEAALLSDRVLVMESGRPGEPRQQRIDLPRPRDRSDPALSRLRQQLLQELAEAHAL
ncbi:MAG: ABC transporter ATP-binding protein [Curvibacter sp.]|nr:ABC transporter ATP-binding protein [Curvibacter sp.]